MKKLFILLLVVMNLSSLIAQDRHDRSDRSDRNRNYNRDVPLSVQRSFQRDNPNSNNVQWTRSGNQWHATYPDRKYNNRNAEVYYDQNGRMRDRHIQWNQNEVPQTVRQNISSRYHVNNGYNVYRVERPNNRPIFQIRLNSGGQNRNIYMDERGREVRYDDRH